MEVLEAIRVRKSIRAYSPTPVPKEKLEKMLEAARLAPSAENKQPWYFVIVTDPERKKQISKNGRFARFLTECPLVIIGCGDCRTSPKWYAIDVAIAMQNMVLVATSEGLGTCWVGSFEEGLVKRLLKIPGHYRVVALLAVGYPKKKFNLLGRVVHFIRRRKKLQDMVGLEEYGRPFIWR